MRSTIKILSIVLLVQLAIWLFLQFSSESSVADQPVLVDEQIARAENLQLKIEDAEGNTATLSRTDGEWQLASGLPADTQKANVLLDKLAALRLSWPVSTNSDSHKRFEVAEDEFQSRLSLTADAAETVVYFGTSPGYQQVHARSANQKEVFAVKVANHELPAEADDWLDKSLLGAADGVASVTWPDGLAVTKAEENWVVNGAPANTAKVEAAVANVAKVQVLGVLESAPTAAPEDAKEILIRDDNGEYRLSFWPREANNDHVLVSTRYPGEAFRVANYVADELLAEVGDLTAKKSEEAGQSLPGLPEIDLQDLDLTQPKPAEGT